MSPMPPGNVVLPGTDAPSPAELLKAFIDEHADASIVPAGAVVGGADDDEQQSGVASLMDAGSQDAELYAPLLKKRVQVRCLGPTLDVADQMANYLFELLHNQRWLILEDSQSRLWYVHTIYCSVSPSHHVDTTETRESLFFAVVTVGSDPVGVPSS